MLMSAALCSGARGGWSASEVYVQSLLRLHDRLCHNWPFVRLGCVACRTLPLQQDWRMDGADS